MKDIKYFIAGCLITALILIPLFYFYFLPHHYWGIKEDQVENRYDLDAIIEHQPKLYQYVRYMIRMQDEFKADMDEREKMILTRDIPSEVEVDPSEKD